MPYIPEQDRLPVEAITILGFVEGLTQGELNYLLTKILLAWARADRGEVGYNEVVSILGTLEAVKLEFYRRVAVPYEDSKRDENGEVYL